ncbi:hypothetical protein MANES_13G093504v8 [Manihot esculenta]|uniref:Uncharacterized protein n=1 Tax=Manihot esculenta TaxID=3983 RepID=A0ACB7GL25_MANES|nr:hypothetical protein MANES_13G093504v8 [Manihot esculenta]
MFFHFQLFILLQLSPLLWCLNFESWESYVPTFQFILPIFHLFSSLIYEKIN